eukprot:CAMPEP_0201733222 /NCGR_PEP_ID=MMETSP0593-20130828/30943_1 /ASSEMBLY_ACC=CAM_ASM_000672 /TAXON_ID=267983 /ORGANISM="Skeletonema japonicum, Strain CCMP2506" /LENGTH=567 /DNA_ID=CAMNT_0048226333 /DNA_START=12 /DNA_END=1715 /DNA_ORIENTATION=+
MKQQQQQQRPRPLEEVLHDPSANWHEIRSAIRGQGGASACTNVAIMQALVNEKSWATAAVATAIVMKEEEEQQKQQQQKDQHEEEANDGCILDNSGDRGTGNNSGNSDEANEADNIIEVLTSPLPIANDSKGKESLSTENNETNNTRSFRRRRGRRGSGVGSSCRRRGTRRNSGNFLTKSFGKGSSASINIMDFGVVDTILDLSDSNRTGGDYYNFRESGDFSDDTSKSGFMGWRHHDDISLKSSFSHDRSKELDGSGRESIVLSEGDADDLKEDFSNLVDSSGFLDWRHSSKRRTSLRSSFVDGDDEEEGDGFLLDWHHSLRKRSSFIGTVDEVEDELSCSNNNNEWNIADYVGPDNSAHSSHYKPMNALTDKLKMFGSNRKIEVNQKDDINISDIKDALLNVRKDYFENDNREQDPSAASRRSTICGAPNTTNQVNLEETTKTSRTRRQTVIGNVALLGAMLNVAKSDAKNNSEIQEDNYLDCSTDATVSKKKAPNLQRKTIIGGIAPFVGMRKDQVEKTADIPTHDDRKAIRISREDGNVDIERECRKLYGLYGDLDCFGSNSG